MSPTRGRHYRSLPCGHLCGRIQQASPPPSSSTSEAIRLRLPRDPAPHLRASVLVLVACPSSSVGFAGF